LQINRHEFSNHATAVGTSLSLGSNAAGTMLRFRLDLLTSGDSLFTGLGAGKPDGPVHVAHAPGQRTPPSRSLASGSDSRTCLALAGLRRRRAP